MKSILDLPLQRKMLAMTLFICSAVLCVAIAALFIFQVLNFRSNFQRDTSTLAVIIANNSTAAMSFKDDQAATEVVKSLKAKPSVVSASLVLPDGTLFANFGKAEKREAWALFPPAGNSMFTNGQLLVTEPVVAKQDQVGTLYLRSDYRQTFWQLVGFYAEIVIGIVLVSIWLAVFLSKRLGHTITHPVLELAKTARIVGDKKDYSLRADVGVRRDELGSLAESFNEMLGRIQSQDAALSLSQKKMEALIHSIDGIVWERTTDTFRFSFVSRQSEEILGYSTQAWLDQPDFWETKLHPQDAAKAIRAIHEAAAQGKSYTQEYRIVTADGRTAWIRESGTVLLEQGKPIAVRGIFQDITRQKIDAEQLDQLHRRLVDTSRDAGMADVATGVLHNVGNILNSAGVSATTVSDRLRKSKVAKLCKVTAMMREQNGRLAEFLTSDPKGKLIPEYLSTVADELAGEQNHLIAKMTAVGEHIEHIKEIVAMQQSYAKVSGVYEDLSAADLVEDAVRLNAAAFERHHIQLVRQCDDNVPKVCVDRHKFLQIFINLLRNAKHAMEDVREHEKRMAIRIETAGPDRVRIVVCDNGVGIPPDHMTKIFNYGFTTKKDGHGFGLHSGANAAREMGGSLTARSDGPGHGAEFTLELPTTRTALNGQKASVHPHEKQRTPA
jgi:PAS domain S-box-containing protein